MSVLNCGTVLTVFNNQSEIKPLMTKGTVPNIVAIEVLKKNGVNVEKLKELITKK